MVIKFRKGETKAVPLEYKVERLTTSGSLFSVIVGATGVGKSTVVREAVSQLKEPRGIVLYSTPDAVAAIIPWLAKTVGYNPCAMDVLGGLRRQWSTSSKVGGAAEWNGLAEALLDAAEAYQRKYNRVPVLVIDAADIIAKIAPDIFKSLVKFAKEQVDDKKIRIIFACGEGSTLPLLELDNSADVRSRVIEIKEIPDEAAKDYLRNRLLEKDPVTKKLKENKAIESRIVDAVDNIAGGRLIYLVQFAEKFRRYDSNAEYREKLDRRTHCVLVIAGEQLKMPVDPNDKRTEDQREKETISNAQETISTLLKRNIILQHPDNTYTFNTRYVKSFFKSA